MDIVWIIHGQLMHQIIVIGVTLDLMKQWGVLKMIIGRNGINKIIVLSTE